MDTSQNARCSLCPSPALDPLGHHALTCKGGGDLIVRHNALRDISLVPIPQLQMNYITTTWKDGLVTFWFLLSSISEDQSDCST